MWCLDRCDVIYVPLRLARINVGGGCAKHEENGTDLLCNTSALSHISFFKLATPSLHLCNHETHQVGASPCGCRPRKCLMSKPPGDYKTRTSTPPTRTHWRARQPGIFPLRGTARDARAERGAAHAVVGGFGKSRRASETKRVTTAQREFETPC